MLGYENRSKIKYKLTAIIFAVLTLYMLVCSIISAMVAISQSGGQIMILSVIITYGGGEEISPIYTAPFTEPIHSVCIQQRTCF